MGTQITLEGKRYASELAFLLFSLDERREVARKIQWEAARTKAVLPTDPRAQAVACELLITKQPAKTALAEVLRRSDARWLGTLDTKRIAVRLFFDKLFDGPTTRNAPGFRQAHLDVMDRELAANSGSRDIACALWRLERSLARGSGSDFATRAKAPVLHLMRDNLPEGVELSTTVSPTRAYEPVIVVGRFAYAVADAIMVLPRTEVRDVVNEVGAWMEEQWPEAIEACDDLAYRVDGYKLDRKNVALAAEAFARGFGIRESAEFIFDQRVREYEARL